MNLDCTEPTKETGTSDADAICEHKKIGRFELWRRIFAPMNGDKIYIVWTPKWGPQFTSSEPKKREPRPKSQPVQLPSMLEIDWPKDETYTIDYVMALTKLPKTEILKLVASHTLRTQPSRGSGSKIQILRKSVMNYLQSHPAKAEAIADGG